MRGLSILVWLLLSVWRSHAGLVLWYPFNETTGSTSVKDYSGNGYHPTLFNSPTFNTSVSAIRLRKIRQQYLSLPLPFLTAFSALPSYSIMAWAKFNRTETNVCFFSYGNSSRHLYLNTYGADGTVEYAAALKGQMEYLWSPTTLAVNTWMHLAVTVTSGSASVYLNGELQTDGLMTITTTALGYIKTGYIGRPPKNLVQHNYMDGWLRDYRVYDYALSAADVYRLIATRTGTPTVRPTKVPTTQPTSAPTVSPALILWYPFNDTAGMPSTAKDYSGNGFTGLYLAGPTTDGSCVRLSNDSQQYVYVATLLHERGRCAFWNSSLKAWSWQGCRRRSTSGGSSSSSSSIVCECTHLSDFGVVLDTYDYVTVTTQNYKEVMGKDFVRRHYGLLIALGSIYLAFVVSVLLVRLRRTKESWEYIKRVPRSKMYPEVMQIVSKEVDRRAGAVKLQEEADNEVEKRAELLRRLLAAASRGGASTPDPTEHQEEEDEAIDARTMASELPQALLAKHHAREVAALARLIRYKRLRRLRSLGPSSHGKGRIAPSEQLELDDTTAEKYLAQDSTGIFKTIGSSLTQSLTLPLNRLDTQQRLILTFVQVLTQLVIAIILTGPNPVSFRVLYKGLLAIREIETKVWMDILWQQVLQSVLSEPVTQVVKLMVLMIGKETAVKRCVGEEIVDRDLELFVPSTTERNDLGPLFVPLVRIGLIQMEVVGLHLREERDATKGGWADRVLLAREISALDREIRRMQYVLKEEYMAQRQDVASAQLLQLGTSSGCIEALKLRMSIACINYRGLADFRGNPLEPIDLQTKVSRIFDDYVYKRILARRSFSWLARWYYRTWVAGVHNHVVGQEFFLFSWRLLLFDLLIAAYVLALTFFLLLISLDVSAETVTLALLSMGGALVVNVLVTSPLVSGLEAVLGRQVIGVIRAALMDQQESFQEYYYEVTQGDGWSSFQQQTQEMLQKTLPQKERHRSSGIDSVPSQAERMSSSGVKETFDDLDPQAEEGDEGEEEGEDDGDGDGWTTLRPGRRKTIDDGQEDEDDNDYDDDS